MYHSLKKRKKKKKKKLADNKVNSRISKQVLQENKAHEIFRKTDISYPLIRGWEMFVFRKIWRALFSCNTRFEIRPFALLPKKCQNFHTIGRMRLFFQWRDRTMWPQIFIYITTQISRAWRDSLLHSFIFVFISSIIWKT